MTMLEKFGGDKQKLSEHMSNIAKKGWQDHPDRKPAKGFHTMPIDKLKKVSIKGGRISRRGKK